MKSTWDTGRLFAVAAIAATLIWAAGFAGSAFGQELQDSPAPAPVAGEAEEADALADMLESLTPAQLQELIAQAAQTRLKVERRQVAAEIGQGVLYEPAARQEALRLLEDKPANTRKDNIDRICRAFAKVDARLAKPYELFVSGEYAKAAEAAKSTLDSSQKTYLSAARHYIYAESLLKAGQNIDGVEAHRDILFDMPEKVSFGTAAALKAAAAYEKMGRFIYAMEMYAFCLKYYGLTLDAEEAEQVATKLQDYQKTYSDRFGLPVIADEMHQVRRRLEQADSGTETQAKQKRIVALLTDLIKTIEEKQKGGGQGKGKGKGKGKKPGEGSSQGQGQGQGKGKGNRPAGAGQPSSHARVSALPPGPTQRPGKLSPIRPTAETGDWTVLPPRERERLEQIKRKLMSEQYRNMIRDYLSRLAQESPE